MSAEITKATPDSAGCWIDGHWGQYGIARMIQIAAEHGYSDRAPVDIPAERLAEIHLASMGPSTTPGLTDSQWEDMTWAADGVELWMNENVAPEGYHFEWSDGEFFLSADDDDDDI